MRGGLTSHPFIWWEKPSDGSYFRSLINDINEIATPPQVAPALVPHYPGNEADRPESLLLQALVLVTMDETDIVQDRHPATAS